eukprot:SM000021S06506  [mRNA]  locus=s21:706587:706957:- [translate_table: standard]
MQALHHPIHVTLLCNHELTRRLSSIACNSEGNNHAIPYTPKYWPTFTYDMHLEKTQITHQSHH